MLLRRYRSGDVSATFCFGAECIRKQQYLQKQWIQDYCHRATSYAPQLLSNLVKCFTRFDALCSLAEQEGHTDVRTDDKYMSQHRSDNAQFQLTQWQETIMQPKNIQI